MKDLNYFLSPMGMLQENHMPGSGRIHYENNGWRFSFW